ncbi:MAG: polyprenyl synthetase family protein [Chloroflexi bacterium]|nr:polyprenyl synthetase family protein [Chloroflexota bacterium]MDA8187246.1 polyprenyl synthetase family protein [Dehalococcoidales bacterium]
MAVASIFSLVADELMRVEEKLGEVVNVEYPLLAAVLQRIVSTGGKRLRPALVLLSSKFYDYIPERLIPIATAVELLHTATLVHDDLIDNSSTRRGVATLNTIISSRATILVGDYLFAQSAALATESNSVRVMHIFSRGLMQICDGELRNIFGNGSLEQTRHEYYRKIESKTAALFVAAAESGAILSNAPEDVVQSLSKYGYNLGMAFQIMDDILDFTGDERKLGKPVGNDLRQGTVTLPAIYLLESRPNDHALRTILQSDTSDPDREEKIKRVVEMIANSSAIVSARTEALAFVKRAKDNLDILPDNEYRRKLVELADYVTERNS